MLTVFVNNVIKEFAYYLLVKYGNISSFFRVVFRKTRKKLEEQFKTQSGYVGLIKFIHCIHIILQAIFIQCKLGISKRRNFCQPV